MDNNIPKGCKPFDLQKAMAGEPVVTRDGRSYKFGAYNPEADKGFELIGWISGIGKLHYSSGKYRSSYETDSDLFMAAKTQKVWVNLWRGVSSGYIYTYEHKTERDAKLCSNINYTHRQFLKTIETEVEL